MRFTPIEAASYIGIPPGFSPGLRIVLGKAPISWLLTLPNAKVERFVRLQIENF
jgi:hypothetical protein